MHWFNAAVTPKFSWPNETVHLQFQNIDVVLSPAVDDLSCRVSMRVPSGKNLSDSGTTLSRFLSRFAWSMDGGIVENFHVSSNNQQNPGLLAQGSYARSMYASVRPFESIYLPIVISKEAELALALYREGMNLNSGPHAFLSFAKILNVKFGQGSDQKNWIENNFSNITHPLASERLKSNPEIGEYFYKQGRCAVAHAFGSPIVDPDIFADRHRLDEDAPIMKELAKLFIENEFRVLSEPSFHKQYSGGKTQDFLVKRIGSEGRISYENPT
jgi:hypothetical protein